MDCIGDWNHLDPLMVISGKKGIKKDNDSSDVGNGELLIVMNLSILVNFLLLQTALN